MRKIKKKSFLGHSMGASKAIQTPYKKGLMQRNFKQSFIERMPS